MAIKVNDPTTQAITPGSTDISTLLQQSQPSTFRKVLGGVLGGATNFFAPGLGSVLGSAIGGTSSLGGIGGALGGVSTGFDPSLLLIQQQVEQQQEQFEMISNIQKAKHDANMSAIQNLH